MARPGTTLSEYFTLDHQSCDSQWTEVENAVERGDMDAAVRLWNRGGLSGFFSCSLIESDDSHATIGELIGDVRE